MNCEKYLNLIDDLVEGELDNQTAEQVNLHIFVCSECAFQYEKLKNEKQIYSHYLFNTEPSKDLWSALEQKIHSESVKDSILQKPLPTVFIWKENILSFFRVRTVFAATVLLIAFGIFGVWQFVRNKTTLPNAAKVNREFNLPVNSSQKTDVKETVSIPDEKFTTVNLIPGKDSKKKSEKISFIVKKTETVSPKVAKFKKQITPKRGDENPATDFQPNSEQKLMELEAKNLEKETSEQVEKIELLLRSFRNARVIEGSNLFDVSYEKQQARKLLTKNVQLRQIAQNYGNSYTEEILDKAESFLLDIANLENNPSQEKIIHIKERVKNQNIIASLQVY